jgi:hypothetical protein
MTALLPDDLDDRVVTPHRPEVRNAPRLGIGLGSRSAMAGYLHREPDERFGGAGSAGTGHGGLGRRLVGLREISARLRAKRACGEPGAETGQEFFSWEAS